MASTFAERLEGVRGRIAAAAARVGRDPASIQLVGVSKRQSLDNLHAAIAAGLRTFGENQVQEAIAKAAELPADLDWHFIGPLQSNKVKRAVRLFDTVHSVDRSKIARLLDKQAVQQGKVVRGFLQVHLGGEASKHGFAEEGLADEVRECAAFEGLRIEGLMALPPYEADLERARHWFRRLRGLRDDLAAQPEWQGRLPYLSMGMSHDFEVAIEEGATHVRVGTTLFGPRPSHGTGG